MSYYTTTSPWTGQRTKEYALISDDEIPEVLNRSDSAYRDWRTRSARQRADVLRHLAEIWRTQADALAPIVTTEIGKPLAQAQGEVALCARIIDYYADQGPMFLQDDLLPIAGGGTAVVRTEPIGTLLGVMPWNYPYYQVIRFAAPNLMLGNTILLKHARNCPQSALAIQDTFRQAGLPDGAYINLFIDSRQVAEIIADPRVQGVSLTGSERAGSAIGELAGRHMKKSVLELGGSDPFIVLDDTELDTTVEAAVTGRMLNAGQACTASKRIIVIDDVYDRFVEKFTEAMRKMSPGDPADPATTFGPLSSAESVDELAEQVDDAVAKGAELLTGGHRGLGCKAVYEATVLAGVTPGMRAYHEELFGPAAVVHRATNEDHAVEIANDSQFGLGAAVFTADPEQGRRVAERLEAGMVWVNGISRSAPNLPFGGIKRSGVGRELGRYGFDEFANKKLIRTVR